MGRKKMIWPAAALIAAGLTLLAGLGVLRGADLAVSDAWYQSRNVDLLPE